MKITKIWVDRKTGSVFLVSGTRGDPPMAKGLISIDRPSSPLCAGLFAEQIVPVSGLEESFIEVNPGDQESHQYVERLIDRCDTIIARLHRDIAFAERLKNEVREISGTQPEEPK